MTTIWYVHGAGASEHSFTWLRTQFPPHRAKFLTYDIADTAQTIIAKLIQAIDQEPEPVILIGHSFGGVIARACAGRTANISHLVTLCAPFGGIKHAGLLAIFSDAPMFRELGPFSTLLLDIRAPISAPHLAIVATHGLPVIAEPNDGAVAVASQTAIRHLDYRSIAVNHFEVLLSPEVASIINDFTKDK